jgi:hypothetical protein
MKKKLTILSLVLVFALSLAFVACSEKTSEATAYGRVYRQYAAMVTVKMKGDKITEVKFKEYLPMQDIGKITLTQGETTTYTIGGVEIAEEDRTLSENGTWYANRIRVGDQIFTLQKSSAVGRAAVIDNPETTEVNEAAPAKDYSVYTNAAYGLNTTTSIMWSENDFKDSAAKNAFTNEAFTKFYIQSMKNGDFAVLKGDSGTESYDIAFTTPQAVTEQITAVTKQQWADKEFNGYGQGRGKFDWLGNMDKMEKAIKDYGFEGYTGEEAKGESGYKLGSHDTGATLNDYHNYMAIARKAYNTLKDENN